MCLCIMDEFGHDFGFLIVSPVRTLRGLLTFSLRLLRYRKQYILTLFLQITVFSSVCEFQCGVNALPPTVVHILDETGTTVMN